MRSLRVRLFTIWALSLAACIAVGFLLVQSSWQTVEAQVGRAEVLAIQGCDLIEDRWLFYSRGWAGPNGGVFDDRLRTELSGLVAVALARQEGVEGGIWQAGTGPLAYSFPTYPGGTPKTDLPQAERDRIEAINLQAAQESQPVSRRFAAGDQTLLLRACPLVLPVRGLTAWTMTRVHAVQGFTTLRVGLGVLLALVVAMTIWLGRTVLVWGRHVLRIERALQAAGSAGFPFVEATGERELDQVIHALNDANTRVATARREADAMADRAGRAERLAGLGRIAAGVAHEIRNPLAAARLQAENAMAGDDRRRWRALAEILEQLGRLDRLVSELLAMTQRVQPNPRRVDLAAFAQECVSGFREEAERKDVRFSVDAAGEASLDPGMIGRVLDNLLANAIRHSPLGGTVVVRASRDGDRLTIRVADEGPGVSPEVGANLFEPFVTGRPDGTGLGLAIARELADAHGGRLWLAAAGGEGGGAAFVLDLPQPDEREVRDADDPDR